MKAYTAKKAGEIATAAYIDGAERAYTDVINIANDYADTLIDPTHVNTLIEMIAKRKNEMP